MTNIFLKYNPYTIEVSFQINGKEINENSRLYSFKNERIQMWLDTFLPILIEEINDDELDIHFHGTILDYEDLLECIQDFGTTHRDVKITTVHKEATGATDRLSELSDLFEYMQKTCPFDDLKDKQIRDNFYSAIGSEFEVSVIATMSSGKSTLINAMLNHELMPAKNEACTATITRIKDIDGMEQFTASGKTMAYQTIREFDNLTMEHMSEMNDDPEIAYINVEGDVPFVPSNNVHLVLVDTPGPNNSRNQEHRDHTYRIIKEKTKPMVLYVLNATQLATNDDDYLLGSVAQAMKVGGKQSKDRFIFAVNKVDLFDVEGDDSIDRALDNVRDYLKKHGIENPNLYPMSAEMAKLIRMNHKGDGLTRKQRKMLNDHDLFIDLPEMHLSKYAPLNKKNENAIMNMIKYAQDQDDSYQEALVHTGVPAAEIAINEYIEKYAVTTKVKSAVDTFIKRIEEKKIRGQLLDDLNSNESARADLIKQLDRVQALLDKGKSAGVFEKRIDNLNMKNEASKKIEHIGRWLDEIADPKELRSKDKMSVDEMRAYLNRLESTVANMQSDIRTDLENVMEDIIIDGAQKILSQYKTYIQDFVNDGAMKRSNFSMSSSIASISMVSVPNASSFINKYKTSERVKVGERQEKNSEREGFFGFFKFWKPWTVTKSVYEDREYVSTRTIIENYIQPLERNLDKNIRMVKKEMFAEIDKFKRYFKSELKTLEAVMNQKFKELKQLGSDKALIEKEIKAMKAQQAWLDGFIDKLNSIIEI